jgi:hypothetical protein
MMDICFRIKTKLLYLYELYKHTSFYFLFSSCSASFICVVILIIFSLLSKKLK